MLKEIILDSRCIICRDKKLSNKINFICDNCYNSFNFIYDKICPRCGHPIYNNNSKECLSCKDIEHIYYDNFRYIQLYTGFFKSILSKLKINDEFMLNKLFFELIKKRDLIKKGIPITVVPDVFFKRFKRGRAGLSYILKLFNKEGYNTLNQIYKKRYSITPQKKKDKKSRIEDIKKLYYLPEKNRNKYSGEIYLVDDIYTTGSTINFGAKLLKEAGFDKVYAVTFFRAVLNPENLDY